MRLIDGHLRLTATDLVNHLACSHLSQLDYEVAIGQRKRPVVDDPVVQLLQAKGAAHEESYIDHLRGAGYQVAVIEGPLISAQDVSETLEAMRAGFDFVVQGSLLQGRWGGRADILRRVSLASDLGSWSYQVMDTKLAQNTKAGTILQLSLYSDLLFQVQGVLPEYMYVVTPWTEFEPQVYRTDDYSAYYRAIKARLESYFDAGQSAASYPDPRDHCGICRWRDYCDGVRRDDDHVSLVGGIAPWQIAQLRSQGISSLEELAAVAEPVSWASSPVSAARVARLSRQAQLQLGSREGPLVYAILAPEKRGVGLGALPEPSLGDLFFGFERAPLAGRFGLQYLFGSVGLKGSGEPEYNGQWAFSEAQEKLAFESFVDGLLDRRSRFPRAHLYQYGRSGLNALVRLAGHHATREAEVQKLVAEGSVVDLYQVVQQGVLASVEQYSLESLEPFYGFQRTTSGGDAEAVAWAISAAVEAAFPGQLDDVSVEERRVAYLSNSDECLSMFHLREWLERLRAEMIEGGVVVERPLQKTFPFGDSEHEALKIIEGLQDGVPAVAADRNLAQSAQWVMANILTWHWKEEIAALQELRDLQECTPDELLEEPRSLAYLDLEDPAPVGPGVHRYRFPSQEVSLRLGDKLYERGGGRIGQLVSLDYHAFTADIRFEENGAPFQNGSVIGFAEIPMGTLKRSLRDLGRSFLNNGIGQREVCGVASDLLLREPPLVEGGPLRRPSEKPVDAALRIVQQNSFGLLPVQGPPGSGKTSLGAVLICDLVSRGRRVGITGNSHRSIANLLAAALDVADEQGIDLAAIRRVREQDDVPPDPRVTLCFENRDVLDEIPQGSFVAAGTPWMWARNDFRDRVDVLFVDEAAQMTLANVLACCRAARNVVLLGDPQQLDQPVIGSHQEGVDVSALGYLLNGALTIADSRGIFLPETYRLPPEICGFTSEVFYERRLKPAAGLGAQAVVSPGPVSGSGLRFLPVSHVGNRVSSLEEVDSVALMVTELVKRGSTWIDREGLESPVGWDDVLIVAPYNAQVQRIQERLPQANVGTVDKFQGQQAPVVIYSMASSSPTGGRRGLEFLYSLNRLNVATSRARCVCVLVASPALFEPDCSSPREIQLANALCRYRELATEIHL